MKTSRNTKPEGRKTNKKQNKKLRQGKVLTESMRTKLAITVMLIMLALIALVFVIYGLIKNNNEKYTRIVLSQRQASYDSRTLPFKRGDIMDRNGTVLASSQKLYNLILDPKLILLQDGKYLEATLQALNEYFGYSKDELRQLINSKPDSSYIKYARELSYDDKTGFLALMEEKNKAYRKEGMPERVKGIWFEDGYKRVYPYNSLASGVLGFADANGAAGTGGVEQYYNDVLTGVNGREYGYLDEDTQLQSVIKQPTNGDSLVTTLNLNIQRAAEKYLNQWQTQDVGSKSASCIVMDPKTGEILAMASTNSFNLNNPGDLQGRYTDAQLLELGRKAAPKQYKKAHPDESGLSEAEIVAKYSEAELKQFGTSEALNQLWQNLPVTLTYEPGSTAKPFTVAGGLEEGAITPESTYNCTGYITLSDGVHEWKIRCNNRNGHGLLDIKHALMKSCNLSMANIAFTEGKEKFTKYQKIFGFGERTGIDLPGEPDTKDLVYTADQMGKTDLATNAFGQNFDVTMVQMVAAYASILNGGNYYKPHVVKQILNEDGAVVRDIKPELVRVTASKGTCDFLKEALFQTVEDGTGKLAQIQGYHVGGKTGTAQKYPRSAKNYLVSFCGFAPVEDPQLLVYVIVDQPNLVGEAQARATFATQLVQKIMNESLQYLNIFPSGETNPDEALNAIMRQENGVGEGIQSSGSGAQTDGETSAVDGEPASAGESQSGSGANAAAAGGQNGTGASGTAAGAQRGDGEPASAENERTSSGDESGRPTGDEFIDPGDELLPGELPGGGIEAEVSAAAR